MNATRASEELRGDSRMTGARLDPDAAWKAVQERDPGADPRLVYGVSSTGIYCRPSCPSKRPKRRHVSFFASSAQAEAAGYRPCLRCRPKDAGPSPVQRRANRVVEVALRRIEAALGSPGVKITLAALASELGISLHHLHRTFRRQVGVSPKEYLDARRLGRARQRLRSSGSVTDAIYEAGYGSSSRLYERSNARLGMTPATYRRGGLGTRIRFTTAGSHLGRVLVAATGRGICSVTLGDDDARLEEALRREFPQAEVVRSRDGMARWVGAVVAVLADSGDRRHVPCGVPLDVRATAFQWRVWKELQRIPPGSTRTYGAVAAAIGRPAASRAVAGACARNPVALLIPCHRVVRGDGGLGGYRWGVERKRRLLARERATSLRSGRRAPRGCGRRSWPCRGRGRLRR